MRKVSKYAVIGAWLGAGMLLCLSVSAQSTVTTGSGNTGITDATNAVKGYFSDAADLMYAIGGILGIIGAIKVYSKWSHGDHDTGKAAAAWFGAMIFLVVVATIIKGFFGL
jgi:Domain of unknown function (DUF4134)